MRGWAVEVDRVGVQRYEPRPLGRTTSGSAVGWVLSDGLQSSSWKLVQVLEMTGVPAQSGCLTASDADRRRVGPAAGLLTVRRRAARSLKTG